MSQRATERDVRPGWRSLLLTRGRLVAIGLQRKIRLSPHQRRVQHHGSPIRFRGFLTPTEVSENETDQIKRVGILRMELDRPAHRAHRLFVQTTVVESFGLQEMQNRAVWIEVDCALEKSVRALQPAGSFLGDPALNKSLEIVWIGP